MTMSETLTSKNPIQHIQRRNIDIAREEWLLLNLIDLPATIRHLYIGLRTAGFEDSLIGELLGRVAKVFPLVQSVQSQTAWNLVQSIMAENMTCTSDNLLSADQYKLMLFGPTGCGKSTVVQKLFYALPKSKRDSFVAVSVVADEDNGSAPIDNSANMKGFRHFLHPLGSPLSETLSVLSSFDYIVIDITGTLVEDTDNADSLQTTLFGTEEFTRNLTMPINLHSFDQIRQLEIYDDFGYDNLIFTKLDVSCCPATMANVCFLSQRPVSLLSQGSATNGRLRHPQTTQLVDYVFSNLCETNSSDRQ